MFSLESPHRGDSYEYTQYTIFNMKKKNHPKLSQICSYGIFYWGRKHELETAMVNEPSANQPRFKVSSERSKKREVDIATSGLVVQCVIHNTTAALDWHQSVK